MIDLKLGNRIQEAFFPKPSGLINYYFNDDVLVIKISKGTTKPYYLREKGAKAFWCIYSCWQKQA